VAPEEYRELVHFLGTRFDAVDRRFDVLGERITKNSVAIESVRDEVRKVAEGVAMNGERLDRMDTRLASVERTVQAHDAKLGAIDGRLVRVEEKVDVIDGRLVRVEETVGSVDTRLIRVEDTVLSIDSRIGTVEARVDLDGAGS